MAQTPAQRRANDRFRKDQEKSMGTYRAPKADKETRRKMAISDKTRTNKVPISRTWVYVLLFILCGGLLVELLRLFF